MAWIHCDLNWLASQPMQGIEKTADQLSVEQ